MKSRLTTAVAENGSEKTMHQYRRLGAKKKKKRPSGIKSAAIGVTCMVLTATAERVVLAESRTNSQAQIRLRKRALGITTLLSFPCRNHEETPGRNCGHGTKSVSVVLVYLTIKRVSKILKELCYLLRGPAELLQPAS